LFDNPITKVRTEIKIMPDTNARLLPLASTYAPTGSAENPSTAGYSAITIPLNAELAWRYIGKIHRIAPNPIRVRKTDA
jgi:hypothetical protein